MVPNRHGSQDCHRHQHRAAHPYDRGSARAFVLDVIKRMALTPAERAALIHCSVQFARNMSERGVDHQGRKLRDWTGPREVTYNPSAVVNRTLAAALWLAALRGERAGRGSRVLCSHLGRIVIGRVIRVNADGTLRVALEPGTEGFGRYRTGVYAGHTLTEVPAECAAVLRG